MALVSTAVDAPALFFSIVFSLGDFNAPSYGRRNFHHIRYTFLPPVASAEAAVAAKSKSAGPAPPHRIDGL
jgi:hypothetical protein